MPEHDGLALVHLRVPRETKNRWINASRAEGLRLTDWLIQKIESSMPKTYRVPDSLADKYHGAGHALAAITGGQIVTIRYIADIAPDEVAEAISEGGEHAGFFVKQWLGTAQAGEHIRELQALGDVSAGMLSSWEFIEL